MCIQKLCTWKYNLFIWKKYICRWEKKSIIYTRVNYSIKAVSRKLYSDGFFFFDLQSVTIFFFFTTGKKSSTFNVGTHKSYRNSESRCYYILYSIAREYFISFFKRECIYNIVKYWIARERQDYYYRNLVEI